MSRIGKNIKKIRIVKKLSQAQLAKLFNLARPSVGAYEEGRAEPKIDTVIQMANHFGLSTDALLTRDLTINELYRFDSLKKISVDKSRRTDTHIKNLKTTFNTRMVTVDNYIDYIDRYRNADFIDSLPAFHFPGVKSSSARAFEMNDQSMSFENAGIKAGDILICDQMVGNKEQLQTDNIYVLVLNDHIHIRRLSGIKKKLKFSADHPDWQPEYISFEDTKEVWEVSGILTRNISTPLQVSKRMSMFEEQLDDLHSRLFSLEKSKGKRK